MTEPKDLGGRPACWETPEQLEKDIEEYFEGDALVVVDVIDGEEIKAFRPTMSGLAISLGVDRKTITNYANKDGFSPLIKKARAKVEMALEQHLYGKNVTGAIFNLKNNFGWSDKQEINQHTTHSVDESLAEKLTGGSKR